MRAMLASHSRWRSCSRVGCVTPVCGRALTSSQILWWVRALNAFEVEGMCGIHCLRIPCLYLIGNSLERIQDYLVIEQEPKPTEEGKPPAFWPASGQLRVESLSAQYSQDGPLELKDISFELKSGERVGVGAPPVCSLVRLMRNSRPDG